jgi:putative ABC transport system permease protein
VAIVSERFVELAWPDIDPVGRTFRFPSTTPGEDGFEVIGVVGDVKNQVVTETTEPFVYFPITQRYAPGTQVAVRTALGRPEALEGLRAALVAADPTMSRGAIASLEEVTSIGLLPQRIAAALTSALALVALLLSALGIYGVVSYAVNARTREIGIRMALGADPSTVVRRLVRSGVLLAGPGLALGALLSLVVGRAVRALLLDLSPFDPVALGSVGGILLTVVVLAAWIPARRATWVDPADSLRRE